MRQGSWIGWIGAAALGASMLVGAQTASAQTFQVQSIDALGCNSGDFRMTVVRAGLDGGSYVVRTVVQGGGLVYMNENASITTDSSDSWGLFDLFNYGSVPNPGTWPIPPNTPLQIDFTLERPVGTVLDAWTLNVSGCNTGTITYNGPTPAVAAVPATSLPGLIALSGALAGLGVMARRRRRG